MMQIGEHWAPEGWKVGTHQHRFWELYLQERGRSCWSTPQGEQWVEPGQGYLVGPGVSHGSLSFSEGSQHFYFVEFDVLAWSSEDTPLKQLGGFQVLAQALLLEPVFRLLVAEAGREAGARQTQILDHVLGLMTLQLERMLERVTPDPGINPHACRSTALLHAQNLMDTHPEHPWRLEELGKLCSLSPQYLSSAFRKSFGVSPMRYLLRCRVNRAKELLQHSELSLTEIALELGFSSLQHFSSRFREVCGQSPSQYRKGAR